MDNKAKLSTAQHVNIYREWLKGKSYYQLAKEYGVGETAIKHVCNKTMPKLIEKFEIWREHETE